MPTGARIDLSEDAFWEREKECVGLARLTAANQNVFHVGGARLNLALSKIWAHWDFGGRALSPMGKRTMIERLPGANGLTFLNLASMGLAGAIPPELAGCMSLKHLDVSKNRLAGPIPVAVLKLRYAAKRVVHLEGKPGRW